MTLEVEQATTKAYCNVLAIQKGLDPAGSAGGFNDAIVLETPLPWKKNIYQEAGALPQEMIDLMGIWLKGYYDGLPYRHRPLMIAPDVVYSRPSYRRLLYYTRQSGMVAKYDKTEYLVSEKELGRLAWALYQAKDDLSHFEQYRDITADTVRDILVCTHGTVDAACAKFGYPLYKHMRQSYSDKMLRVWRVSHFGGHVFAPTLMDMPTGHYWAYVEELQAKQIITRLGAVDALRGYYRGWAGMDYGFMQLAEREMWQHEGWGWFDYHKSGITLAKDANEELPQWAEVRIEFTAQDLNIQGTYEARIEVKQHVETEYATNNTETHPYPQYVVTQLKKISEE